MQKEMMNLCNSKTIRFPRGHWSFLRAWIRKEVVRDLRLQTRWILEPNCRENVVQRRRIRSIFRGASALERGELRSKEGGKTSIHFNGSTQIIELILQIISVNQLSIGAVAEKIEELPVGQKAPGKPAAPGQLDKQEILTQLPLAEMHANEERQGNLLQEYEQRFEKLSEDQKFSRLCSEAGLRLVEIGQFFFALPLPRGKETQSLCRGYSMPQDQDGTRIKGWIQSNVRFGPVSDIKVCNHYGRYSIEVQVQSLIQDQTV